jgi:chromosome condensin MukBEF ATPase and DNA-binding subunit MukB
MSEISNESNHKNGKLREEICEQEEVIQRQLKAVEDALAKVNQIKAKKKTAYEVKESELQEFKVKLAEKENKILEMVDGVAD